MKTQIYVDAKHIRNAGPRPPIAGPLVVRTDGQTRNAREIVVHGPSRFVTNLQTPLMKDGPHVWVETDAEVEIVR